MLSAYCTNLHLTCNPLLYLGPTSSSRLAQVWVKLSTSNLSKSFFNLFTNVMHFGIFSPMLC